MNRLTSLIAIVAALVALASPVRAQQISVRAAVSSQRVVVGDTVTYQIIVEGTQGANPPELNGFDGFTAAYNGASQNIQVINGRMSQTVVMQWSLTPTRKGRLTIPSVTVTVNNQSYKTDPITVSSVDPVESPDFKFRLELPKQTAYVGEPLKARLVLYLGKEARAPQFSGPDGGKAFDIAPATEGRPAGSRGGNNDPVHPEINFLGTRAVGTLGQGELDGAPVATFTLDLIVTPRKAGHLDLGPYNAGLQVVVGRRSSDLMDSPFIDRSVTQRTVVPSNAVSLEVKPLPEEGKPAGFNGLIGEYTVASGATTKDVNVGDPIPFTVKITGPEPMNSVSAPDLSTIPGFENFKPAPEGWQNGTARPGERTFTTTIRPRSDKLKEIPPVELSFFDTSRGEYRTARSYAVPLKVAPTKEVTSADAIGGRNGATGVPGKEARPLHAGPGGVFANYESDEALVNTRVSALDLAGSPLGTAALAGPPVLCLALSIARGRTSVSTAAGRRRRALAHARRLLRRADAHNTVGEAVAVYVGGALSGEPAAITSTDARSLLTEAGSALGERTERLLASCEYARFGHAAPNLAQLKAEAGAVIAELHGELGKLS